MTELPIQRWALVFVLKEGSQINMITEMTEDDIRVALGGRVNAQDMVKLSGVTPQGWPTIIYVAPASVQAWFMAPHEVYLAARGQSRISLQ